MVSGSLDHTWRVWDVKSGDTIVGPIKATSNMPVLVCYSPDGTMIATSGLRLKIWDANTGELLKTIEGKVLRIAWTSIDGPGKTLILTMDGGIKKLETATWTQTAFLEGHNRLTEIILSANERILASVSNDSTARIWNLENDQLIGPPLHHEKSVKGVAFSADRKFLITGCIDGHIYTWDISAIIKEAGLDNLLLDNVSSANLTHLILNHTDNMSAPSFQVVCCVGSLQQPEYPLIFVHYSLRMSSINQCRMYVIFFSTLCMS